jgi:hypothetical protein
VNDFSQNSSDPSGKFPNENVEKWKKSKALSADMAIRACMECRNSASRGIDNIADQLGAIERRRVVAAVVALPRPGIWTAPTRILAPTGKGTEMFVWVDEYTQQFLVSPGELEAMATLPQPLPLARWLASKLRSTATKCCEGAVKKRLWKQTNKLVRKDVTYHRTRRTRSRKRFQRTPAETRPTGSKQTTKPQQGAFTRDDRPVCWDWSYPVINSANVAE